MVRNGHLADTFAHVCGGHGHGFAWFFSSMQQLQTLLAAFWRKANHFESRRDGLRVRSRGDRWTTAMYGRSLSDCTTLWCTYALGASCKSSTTSGSALLRRRKSSFFPCARAPFWIGSCPNTERSNSRHERVDFGGKIRHVSRFKATRSSGNSPFVNNYSQLQHNYFFLPRTWFRKKSI